MNSPAPDLPTCSHGHLCGDPASNHYHLVPTASCPPCEAIRLYAARHPHTLTPPKPGPR